MNNFQKKKEAKMILKTKNDREVQNAGLYPGETVYEIKQIIPVQSKI